MAMTKCTSPSSLWEVFELTNEVVNGKQTEKAICKLCDRLRVAYGGGSTNLQSHLQVNQC